MRIQDLVENTNSAESNSQDFDSALQDFTEAVKQHLSKRAERTYRKSGEEWNPKINELEAQYLDSLKMENLRNWVRYSYEIQPGRRTPAFFVLKSDTKSRSAGDVFMPNSQGRPDTAYVEANIFDQDSVDILASSI
jgi:hypothetical protein